MACPELPQAIRAGILAIVRAASRERKENEGAHAATGLLGRCLEVHGLLAIIVRVASVLLLLVVSY